VLGNITTHTTTPEQKLIPVVYNANAKENMNKLSVQQKRKHNEIVSWTFMDVIQGEVYRP